MTTPNDAPPRRPPKLSLFDAHNHLQDEWLAPHLEKVLAQLEEGAIAAAVVNGTTKDDWDRVAELSRRCAWIRPSYGVHPWLVGQRSPTWEEQLRARLEADPRSCLGEIGLDRWILESARPDDARLTGLRRAPMEEQRLVFEKQLQLGAERNLPTTIHCLDAWGALVDVLGQARLPERGFLLHAYGGSMELMKQFAARGAYFSFNGYFLGERKEKQQAVFREVPLDRLLVETDAPSMPLPQAWRTHKLPPGPNGTALNHPGNLEAVYVGLAKLRGMPIEELAGAVEQNFWRFFGRE
jgi:TatD DNase family protein